MHSHALLLPQVHGLAHQVDGVTGFGDRGFADSAVEGDGFELSVPGRETVKPSWETGLLSRKRERICWGTEGFESISLQRRVNCEPDLLDRHPCPRVPVS